MQDCGNIIVIQMCWWRTDIWSQPRQYPVHPLTPLWSLKGHDQPMNDWTLILVIPCQMVIPFLRYSYLKNWPWKSWPYPWMIGLTSVPFHVKWPSHSWDGTISKFDLKIKNQGQKYCEKLRSHSQPTIQQIYFFLFHINQTSHSTETIFLRHINLTLKIYH